MLLQRVQTIVQRKRGWEMSGGIRTHCPKCRKKLVKSDCRCMDCGWYYGKEFGGQQELKAEEKEVEDVN